MARRKNKEMLGGRKEIKWRDGRIRKCSEGKRRAAEGGAGRRLRSLQAHKGQLLREREKKEKSGGRMGWVPKSKI